MSLCFSVCRKKGPPWKQALRTSWWFAHSFRPRATQVAWQDLGVCEVRVPVQCGDPWRWLCKSLGASHDVKSWIRSGPHSPLWRCSSRVIWPFLCHAYVPLVRVLWSFSKGSGRMKSKWHCLHKEGEQEWRVFGRRRAKCLNLREQMIGREGMEIQLTLDPHGFELVHLHVGCFRDSTGL